MRKEHSSIEEGIKPEKCDICGKDFLYLHKYMKAVQGNVLEEETCEICRKT